MTFSHKSAQKGDPSPSLTAIRSFVAAAKYCSFTKAAQELRVTQSAISRIVRELEANLGVQLLRRAGRSLELTQAGTIYYAQVSEALNCIDTATSSLHDLNDNNILSIGALPTLATRWLLPRLPHFQQLHPNILIDIVGKIGSIDFSTERIDIGILFGLDSSWKNANATLLMTEQLGVFCAPSFLKHKRPLRAPQDLPKHTLLRISTREAHWDYYFTTFGMNNVDLTHNPTFEHFFMIVEAAAAGMGIALLPLFLVQDELRSGRLIQALPHIAKPKEAYYIVISRERESQRKVRLLKKWLLEEARRSL